MSRRVSPTRVAQLQRRYLQRQGASAMEIRRYQPILTAQIGQESNFTQGIGSPAGARDIAQFMPGTAPGYGVKLGDNRIKDDIRGQVRYMLPLLRKYGVEGALRGYNAGVGNIDASHGFGETNNYVRKIRGAAGEYRGLGGGGGGGRGGQSGQDASALLGAADSSSIPGGSGGTLALLQALQDVQGGSQPPSSGSGLQAPAASAAPPLPQGLQVPVSGGGPAAKPDVGALLDAVRTIGSETPGVQDSGVPNAMTGGGGGQQGGPVTRGKVTVNAGADRDGVSTRPGVLRFLERVAGEVGHPLTVGTGTNHNQMTTSGNVSEHWTGHAADVPLAGKDLTQAGRAALRAAGWSAKQARAADGGIYNVTRGKYRYQIIFNTTEGGNHFNHLHVGVSRAR